MPEGSLEHTAWNVSGVLLEEYVHFPYITSTGFSKRTFLRLVFRYRCYIYIVMYNRSKRAITQQASNVSCISMTRNMQPQATCVRAIFEWTILIDRTCCRDYCQTTSLKDRHWLFISKCLEYNHKIINMYRLVI